ncbi:MAG: glycosyltransferase family protein [Candidatus Sericytochromatia bacterium]
MRILYLGVFDGRRWRTEYAMCQGLTDLGHTVHAVNFRSRWPGHVLRAWKRYRDQSDLVFLQNGQPFKTAWLSEMASLPLVFHASEYAVASAQHILDATRPPDCVLAHSDATARYSQAKGLHTERIHHAYDARYYRRLELPYRYDAAFVGSLNPRRRQLLAPLQDWLGERLFVGEIWDPERLNALYNSSRVVLHLHAAEAAYVPTRLFEVLPTQGALLTENLGPLPADLPLSGYSQFAHVDELRPRLEALLQDETLRQQQLAEAWAIAPQHSWAARMQQFSAAFTATRQRF